MFDGLDAEPRTVAVTFLDGGASDNCLEMTGTLPRNMPALTGVRGIAALWVLLFHLSIELGIGGPQWLRPIPASGWIGVDLFFLLSGFVLMHSHHADFHQSPTLNALSFFQGALSSRLPP